jgi:hypothetical protein
LPCPYPKPQTIENRYEPTAHFASAICQQLKIVPTAKLKPSNQNFSASGLLLTHTYKENLLMTTSTSATYRWDLPLIKDKGYQGESVRLLQKLLIAINYLDSADAIYNAETIEAVKKFQADHEEEDGKPLVVDGQVGNKTWHVLMDHIPTPNS